MRRNDALIVGAGPVGLALALALEGSGLDIALVDARTAQAAAQDPRVLALAWGSRLLLERLGVWQGLPVTPIESIHVSQQGGFGRTLLTAAEHDLPALGYVLPAGALARVLRAAVEAAGIEVLDETEVAGVEAGPQGVVASLAGTGTERHGTALAARLAVRAEGQLRADDAGVCSHDYGQHALIGRVGVRGGHRNLAFERFAAEGPLALLPMEDGYALVHVVAAARADSLLALDDKAYLALLQQAIGQRVRLESIDARNRYPLGLHFRRNPTGARTVWLGNAAQTLHPVAGQGFNLALRDVHTLAQTLRDGGDDPGAATVLDTYARTRRLDRFSSIGITDGLVRLFGNTSSALRRMRGAGLLACDLAPPLRGLLARRMMFGVRA